MGGGRFKLGSKIRLASFIITKKDFYDRENSKTKVRWETNTFYVVFLDEDHKFWKTEPN
ncbi:hypothetical protein [Halarcobacter sp.]|uniref:hypothetical protein n=1 Tax=Halarcobacter sp. TaxID=2321133 RepID=UPI003B000577